MKNKPQAHFWIEKIGVLEHGKPGNKGYQGTTVYALNVCRSWDVPANGVFMIFMHHELFVLRGTKPNQWIARNEVCYEKVMRKLEARERALVAWYGRTAKHHLDQIELTPAERREHNASPAQHQF